MQLEQAGLPTGVRIGLSGASGAGKTTFARALVDRFGLKLHEETVRTWLKDQGDLNYSSLTPVQSAALQLHLLHGYESSQAELFDRTPLDAVVYAKRVANAMDYGAFVRRCAQVLATFDVVLFFPAYSPFLKADGVRVPNLKHQVEIASAMFIAGQEMGLDQRMLVYDHGQSTDANIQALLAALVGRQQSFARLP